MKQANEVGAFDAKNHLSELLREVEKGQSFVITRHGRAVARLVPAVQGESRRDLPHLWKRLDRLRASAEGTVDVLELIEEGRRA